MKKNVGLSLLELILVIAVIGIIAMLSFRYFSSTKANLSVVRGIHEINRVTEASYTWLQENNRGDFSKPKAISMQQLIKAGLLSPRDERNTWGGEVEVKPGSSTRYVRVKFAGLSKKACRALTRQLETVSHVAAPSCSEDTDHNVYYGDF